MYKTIHIMPDDVYVKVPDGTILSEALSLGGIGISHPCGGLGVCLRCIVYSKTGEHIIACKTFINQDMEVYVPDMSRLFGQKVLMDLSLYKPERKQFPLVERFTLKLPEPNMENSISDAKRLKAEICLKFSLDDWQVSIEPECLRSLPHKLRANNDFSVTVTICHEDSQIRVISLDEGPLYGVAVDIGTTTVVTALCDLLTGEVLDSVGVPNSQATYGADVISRIVYVEEHEHGDHVLQGMALRILSDSINALVRKAQVSSENIAVAVIAANTVMTHLLLKLPADYLRREPYVPAATEFSFIRPDWLGLPMLPSGRVVLLPSVSSYVGGDITSGVIALDLAHKKGINLFVDVGTNGEIVLAGDDFMMACSCSAGPAFEGSGISCGSRAVSGAIDDVSFEDGRMHFTVIGDEEPASVCGSGLISLLNALLKAGLIDRFGRFTTEDDFYELSPQVIIHEHDIQNLIRAKAAIFAGISLMLQKLSLTITDLDHVYIAGGFGKSLNIEHAIKIGMLPPLPKESFTYVGNSSLAGALMVLTDRTHYPNKVAASITNLELSIGNDFMLEFTRACFLPHTDLGLFDKYLH